ncbi:hypothetical protein KI387_043683, partial [Taxus chinensis]
KSEAFETFKKFKVAVEKENGRHIRTLCSNQGGEFTSDEFRDYLQTHGIHRQCLLHTHRSKM